MTALDPALYLVATPIGTARDVTLRALDILGEADVLLAEDTRTLRRLLDIHGIALAGRPLWAYHDHNGAPMRPRILAALGEGLSVALTSDAGTPLVADPGYALVQSVVEAGHAVTAAPGPSSVPTALALSGLPSDRFLFAGFVPAAAGARRTFLRELAGVQATLVLFDTAKRCSATVREMTIELGEDRRAALCRELTKRFEEVRRGTLADLAQGVEAAPPKGEIVWVVDRARRVAGDDEMMAAIDRALERMSVREAAEAVSVALGLPRRRVYQAALGRKGTS